jgi:N-[(2S)-2-amino-2-carboxyethyl]-L-glutamate dehydrogenase
MSLAAPGLAIIGAPEVARCLEPAREECAELVRRAYLTHAKGRSSLPHSTFLRLPQHERDRIIALPGYLGGDFEVAGVKWIASWPGNVAAGLPRASAMLVLNDPATGFPLACLEASLISATRTAASAVVAAECMVGGRSAERIGFIGTGLIADHVRRFFRDLNWKVAGHRLFDLSPRVAEAFAGRLTADGATDVQVAPDAATVFAECDVVVLATVADTPHLTDPALLSPGQAVLHLSLRDLAPELIVTAQNITDDADHVLRERTSLELARQRTGHTEFLIGTIADLLGGAVSLDPAKPTICSPFGLGILDLAIGKYVYDQVRPSTIVSDFYQGIDIR